MSQCNNTEMEQRLTDAIAQCGFEVETVTDEARAVKATGDMDLISWWVDREAGGKGLEDAARAFQKLADVARAFGSKSGHRKFDVSHLPNVRIRR